MGDQYIQREDKAVQAILNGEPPVPDSERYLNQIILGFPKRQFYIAKKAIFLAAVIAYAKTFGKNVNKQQTQDPMSHCLIDAFAKLNGYNHGTREDFFEAIATIVPAESSHDRFYRDRMIFLFEELIVNVLAGRFPTRGLNSPDSKYWSEEEPYGGQHTIIARLALYGPEIMEMIRRPKDADDEPYKRRV